MAVFKDDFHNRAVIEQVVTAPYYGAKKQKAYRLICADAENFVYFVSVYETVTEAMEKLKSLSAGTFREIVEN